MLRERLHSAVMHSIHETVANAIVNAILREIDAAGFAVVRKPPQSDGEFAPCPTCHQYSHSIGADRLAEAFMHFQSMIAHPLHGRPMSHAFDEKTRDAVQVLLAAAQDTK